MSFTDFFYDVDDEGNKKINKMKTAAFIIILVCVLSIIITLLNP